MGLLEKLWNWLTTSSRGTAGDERPDPHPIDVEKIAKQLDLTEEARRLGAAGLPAVDATMLSYPEAAVVQRIEKARQDYVDWGALRINVLSQDLGKRNVTQDVNRAAKADEEFERRASGLLTERHSHLSGLREDAQKRESELKVFKTRHALDRDAHYPTPTGTYFRYSILLLLIIVEGVLNAGFFAQGLDTGYLGGFSSAGILAAINVIIAFAFGKFAIRHVNHTNVLPHTLALLAIALSLAIVICIGLGIAHYRDSLNAEVADAARSALQGLIESPFRLRDFFSWTLFIVSVAFGIASLFDGLYTDDPYPGYGSISRRTKDAVDDHNDELTNVRIALEDLRKEVLLFVDETASKSHVLVVQMESLIEGKKMAGCRLATALHRAEHSLEALIRKFRTENELHRQEIPRPRYFDQQVLLQPIQNPDFDTTLDESAVAEQRALLGAFLANLQDIRARIQAAYNSRFDSVKPLDSHFPNGEPA